MMRRPYQLALVCILVFSAFYMTIHNELCVVDDFPVMMDFFNVKDITWRQLFMPGSAAGGYYRPLVAISYLINLRLWDLNGPTLHLENILMHVANAALVFLLTLNLLPPVRREKCLAPIAAGLIFGLHPMTTESVNWISGRTDLIAGGFVLISAILVVRYRNTGSIFALVGAVCAVLIGVLGKETALGFIPGAFFILIARNEDDDVSHSLWAPHLNFKYTVLFILLIGGTFLIEVLFFNYIVLMVTCPLFIFTLHFWLKEKGFQGFNLFSTTRGLVAVIVTIFVAFGVFITIHKIAFTSYITRVPQTIHLMGQDLNYTMSIFLGTTGFYLKKFFIPAPLNFAIREIDPLYALLGSIIIFIAIVFAARRTLPTALSLAGAFLFIPALPLAFGKIAWTAYAERYIYISTAFWTISLVLWITPYLERLGRRYIFIGSVVLLLPMAGVTIQRNLIWKSNMSLIQDTVAKSPDFQGARIIYMGLLMESGDLHGARTQYIAASSLHPFPYDERLDGNYAELLLKEGKPDEAIAVYNNILTKTHGESGSARRQIRILLEAKIAKENDPELRNRLATKLTSYGRTL